MRPLHHSRQERLAALHLVGIVVVDHHQSVEIAVADVADHRHRQPERLDVAPGFGDAIGQARDRHADVAGTGPRSRAGAPAPPRTHRAAPATAWSGAPARSPSRTARRQARAAISPNSVACSATPAVRAVELDEQHRRHRQIELGVAVGGAPLPPRRAARCAPPGCRCWMVAMVAWHAASTEGNGQMPAEIASGMPAQADGQLGDDAERALRADQKAGQVIAGRGLLARLAVRDHLAIGQHRRQRQHIVAHGAVAHRIGAGGAGRGHAAERGVGAGIDREEQAGVAQVAVELRCG